MIATAVIGKMNTEANCIMYFNSIVVLQYSGRNASAYAHSVKVYCSKQPGQYKMQDEGSWSKPWLVANTEINSATSVMCITCVVKVAASLQSNYTQLFVP